MLALCLALALSPSAQQASEASIRVILQEDFEDPGALERWTISEGVHLGEGPASEADVVDGALRLAADGGTTRWTRVERVVPVEPESWLRISARMAAEGVESRGTFASHHVDLRFGDHPPRIGPSLGGSRDWTSRARRYRVPADVHEAVVGAYLSVPGTLRFDEIRLEVVPDWVATRRDGHVYWTLPGDEITADDHAFNGESLNIGTSFMGVARPARVDYFKYPDAETKFEYFGHYANGEVRGGAIHTIWPTDRHEIMHLLAEPLGTPPALFGEGSPCT